MAIGTDTTADLGSCCPSVAALDAAVFADSFARLLWPVVALVVVAVLLPLVRDMLKKSEAIEIEAGGFKLSMSRQTKELFVEPVLDEVSFVFGSLSDRNRRLFVEIYRAIESGAGYTLRDDFQRESDFHNQLRAMRELHLVRPVGGGRWKQEKAVELTRFAKLFVRLKHDELFEARSERGHG